MSPARERRAAFDFSRHHNDVAIGVPVATIDEYTDARQPTMRAQIPHQHTCMCYKRQQQDARGLSAAPAVARQSRVPRR